MKENSDLQKLDNKTENLIDENKDLTEEEILKCKDNGFILVGKTGVGKTSLLNVIFEDEVGKVGHSSKSETKKSNYYCIKEKLNKEIIFFCVIDTPGLYDTNGIDDDINQKKDIQKLIATENIKIKGILFLSNFQNERFDFSEQNTLIEYNALFPMKDFWSRIILIFTHYYSDPDGDSKEEIQQRSITNFTTIMKNIMEKTKKISNPIDFLDINRQYVNIYSRIKNEKQIKNNKSIRNSLIIEISKYINLNPMLNKLQMFHFEKYEIEENDEYLYDCDLIIYLDDNNNYIYKDLNIINKYSKNNYSKEDQKIEYYIQSCKINEEGYLVNINNKREGYKEIFKNTKSKVGCAMTIFSIIGIIFSGVFFPVTIPVCITTLFGGILLLKNSSDEQRKIRQDKINEIIENNRINEEIKKGLEKKDI